MTPSTLEESFSMVLRARFTHALLGMVVEMVQGSGDKMCG